MRPGEIAMLAISMLTIGIVIGAVFTYVMSQVIIPIPPTAYAQSRCV